MIKVSDKEEHSERNKSRFINSMIGACVYSAFLHLLLAIFYFFIDVPEMLIYAVISFFLFLAWSYLFKNKWILLPFILSSINCTIGIILANYFIGWESNFNIYFMVLPAAVFLYPNWEARYRVFYMIVLGFAYFIAYLIFSDFKAIYEINSQILQYVSMLNSFSAAGIMVVILLFLNSSILKMQTDLENKNSDLKYKADELDDSLNKEKELGQLKTSFVTTASHQFRTPLAVIQSNAQLLEMFNATGEKIEPVKYKKVSGRITGAIAKMTGLMDDVLILGKLTSGSIQYVPQEIDLVEFCENLVEEFNDVKADGSHLNFVIKGEPYNVALDPKLLTHSLSNLISNALKYSIGKKNPDLTIDFKPNELVLSIKDYGIGIPEEEFPKLFQPFFRANNVAEIKGTGLGLSIAKEYVEINKGQISASSLLGEGSCFEITFKR